jgi:WD40 repeat protein
MARTYHTKLFFVFVLLLITVGCSAKGIAQPTPAAVTPAVVLTASPTQAATLPSLSADKKEQCFTPTDFQAFAFTPDNNRILIRGSNAVRIFNLVTLQQESYLQAPMNIITAELSPDGEMLAWSLEDNSIQLLNLSDQEVLQTMTGHTDMVTKLRFSPMGDLLVSASHDFTVRFWDLQGNELRTLQAGQVLGIGISPDGSTLATVPSDGPVTLWDMQTLEKVKELGGYGGYDTSDAYFSPDGQFLAADLASGLYLWRIADAQAIWDGTANSMAAAFSPDGRFLAYVDISQDNKIVLAAQDGARIIQTVGGEQGPAWELFFSPNSQLLASGGVEIQILDTSDGSVRYIGKDTCP